VIAIIKPVAREVAQRSKSFTLNDMHLFQALNKNGCLIIRVHIVLNGIVPARSTMLTVFDTYNRAFVGQSRYDPPRLAGA
jgi:hypothetical protein